MRGATAAAGDFTLLLGIHRGKPASASASGASLVLLVIILFRVSAMGCPPAAAGDFTLFFGIHCREAPAASAAVLTMGLLTVAMSTTAVFLGGGGMPPGSLGVTTLQMLGRLTMMMSGAFMKMGRVMMSRQPAKPADFGHVFPVAAYGASTFSPCLSSFFGVPLVGVSTFVSGHAASAGNFPLLFRIHCRKPALS